MAEEIENGVESEEIIDTPVAGITDAITDEPDPTLKGLDTDVDDAVEAAAPETDTKTEDTPETASSTPSTGITLPAAHVRSLKAYGWSDEEIKQNLSVLGDKFLTTAARIHKNRNDEVTSWADAGRKARQEQQNPPQKTRIEEVTPTLQKIDGDRLKKQYGEHELIDSLVKPYNQLLEEFQRIAPIVQQSQQRTQQAELETFGRQIEAFFGSKELEPLRDVYGTASNMTEAQIAARNKVLETADALRVGARVQGRELSPDAAMQLAIDSVSSGTKTQVARNQIREGLRTRGAAITLKPSGKGARPANAKPQNRGALEKKVGTALSALFPDS